MKLPTSYRSRGHLMLVKRIHPTDRLTFSEIARRLDVSHETVRQWFAGTSVPTELHQAALEKHYGIPRLSWGETAGQEKSKRKRAA